MRIILTTAAGATIFGMVGLGWAFWPSLVGGLILGFLIERMFADTGSPTHRVIVEEIHTGKVKIQPNDRATQQYINSRKG